MLYKNVKFKKGESSMEVNAFTQGLIDSEDQNKTFEDNPFTDEREKSQWIKGFISGTNNQEDTEDLESELLIEDC